MANIYDLANELEREIRVLPEYKKAQECRAAEVLQQETEKKIYLKNNNKKNTPYKKILQKFLNNLFIKNK